MKLGVILAFCIIMPAYKIYSLRLPARVNYGVTFVTPRKLSELHASRRATVTGSAMRSRHRRQGPGRRAAVTAAVFLAEKPGLLTQAAALGGVIGSVNNSASIPMNDVSEAAD